MSQTFWCPSAAHRIETRPCDDPECKPGHRCGYCKDGVIAEDVSEAPEFNLNNDNAAAIRRLAGMPDEICGTLQYADMPRVRQQILAARNMASRRAQETRETTEAAFETGKARCIDLGLNDVQIAMRLELLDTLLAYAQEKGFVVSWG